MFKCMRDSASGSMYYGEVAYVRKETNQLIKMGSQVYETEIKPMGDE